MTTTTQPFLSAQTRRSGCPARPHPLKFGTDWCGHCRAAQPALTEALAPHAGLRHTKVEGGPGQALGGRSFRVKRWLTLVLLRHAREVVRVVRPTQTTDISDALSAGGCRRRVTP